MDVVLPFSLEIISDKTKLQTAVDTVIAFNRFSRLAAAAAADDDDDDDTDNSDD